MESKKQTFFKGEPTKDFFIDFLTKDIALDKAIIDLVDNSIDAAKSQKSLTESHYDFSDNKIELFINEDEFIISDNCGGFSLDVAKDYALRIGRPDGIDFAKNSIGRFGVGMKRAVFKLGKQIYIESKCHNGDHFKVEIDVDKWKNKTIEVSTTENEKFEIIDWNFDFELIEKQSESRLDKNTFGTFISVKHLREEVKEEFRSNVSIKKLIVDLETTLAYSLENGLKIFLNKISLQPRPILLLYSDLVKPYAINRKFGDISVDIIAGVGEPSPDDAGWYIYCNDRMMISANKENLTGWQGGKNYFSDTGVQKYHNKVAMFRGLVFFNAEDSKLLPMTTTKIGIDSDSKLYKSVRELMIEAMKIVLSKLNEIDSHDDRKNIVDNTEKKDVKDILSNLTQNFYFPNPETNSTDSSISMKRISYQVDGKLFENVAEFLNTKTGKTIGIETFNYFVKMNDLDEIN
ncbi:ATP-binding protein [Chryseobacterium sp. RRHN12]|uniref:ATP-binding protein n=1 Tax=Chryseobacterium sp. RRHN12 TaxID=3437884 RepID=UPI003D9B025F